MPQMRGLQADFAHLVTELSNDKHDILRDLGEEPHTIKMKIEALAWHGRVLSLLSVS